MPGRNATGPMGQGPMTGRGLGLCGGGNAVNNGVGYGMGFGYGRGAGRGFGRGFGFGYGRGFYAAPIAAKTQKELLQEEKAFYEERLDIINKQLDDKEDK